MKTMMIGVSLARFPKSYHDGSCAEKEATQINVSGHQIKARFQQNVRVVLLPCYYTEIVKLTCWVRWDIVSSFKRIIAKIFEGEIQ